MTGFVSWLYTLGGRLSVLAVIALSGLVLISAIWNIDNVDDQAVKLATDEARANWNKDQTLRRWATRHGGVYVRPDERTPPNPYLEHLPNRDVFTTDGMKLTLMNPAYIMNQIATEFEILYGIKSKITGQVLLNPKNKADPWELAALKQFDQGIAEVFEQANIDGQPFIRLMRPMIMTKGCVMCHGHLGFKVGDIRGGVSIAIPLTPFLDAAAEINASLLSFHGLVWLMGMLTIGFIVRLSQKHDRERTKAHQALLDSQETMRALADHIPEFISLKDTKGRYLFVNKCFEKWVGIGQDSS